MSSALHTLDTPEGMNGPYPSPETAAHMIAEEILVLRRNGQGDNARGAERRRYIIRGLERAAWLLNVEDIVKAKLEAS